MAEHHLTMTPSASEIARVEVGDIVYLSGEITVTGGLPTHLRLLDYLDRSVAPPFPLQHSLIHLPIMQVRDERTGHYTLHYVNPTTSMRFDAYMPRLIRGYDLRIIGGKGGVGPESVKAMREVGCIYLSLLGGGAPILTGAVQEVTATAHEDLPTHFRLSRLRVDRMGPLTVGIDARGRSTYESLSASAQTKLPDILAQLNRSRTEKG